jgi:hypothetical protein
VTGVRWKLSKVLFLFLIFGSTGVLMLGRQVCCRLGTPAAPLCSFDWHIFSDQGYGTNLQVSISSLYFFFLRAVCLLSSFLHLLIGIICSVAVQFLSSLYILDINPLSG